MLSDRGIRDYIEKELLKVEPMGQIGQASIDLHIGSQLYRSNSQAHFSFEEELSRLVNHGQFFDMLKKQEDVHKMAFDQYVSQFGIPVAAIDGCWILEPNKGYYAETDETITTKRGIHVQIATRSSLARIGIRTQYSEEKLDRAYAFEGKPFLVLQTCGTTTELPKNHSVCQIAIEPSRYLFDEEIEEAIRRGDITVSGKPLIKYDSIVLTFHPRLLIYNGKTMSPTRDNSDCFEEVDITHGYILVPGRFYLASTQETVGIGRGHVGVLNEFADSVYVHLNAPYHWPGSNHSITLEIFSREPRLIRAGNPACRLLFQQLYPECEFLYNSKYNGQAGPTTSRSHL